MNTTKFLWTARLFEEKKVIDEKFFNTQEERDTFVSLNPNWKKRGKICASNLSKHKGSLNSMERVVDENIKLIPYYRNDEVSLVWYQDLELCKQVDNRDEVYDINTLHRMYDYLCNHGTCYYIEYKGILVGDVSLQDSGEVAIVVCKEYQNMHIGRKCIVEMIKLAKEKGMSYVTANIYSFNKQSRRMFEAVGFYQTSEEEYRYD